MSTPPRPRALLFSHICNPDHITGAEKLLLFTILELGRQYDCTLVVPREGLLAVEARKHGIKTVIHSYPLLYAMYQPSPELPSMLQTMLKKPEYGSLLDILLLHEPDVVITNTCVNILPAVAAKKLGIPVVWMITETIQLNEATPYAVGFVDQYSDWIVGISYATLELFQTIGLDHKKFNIPPSWRTDEYDVNQWPARRQITRADMGIHDDEKPIIGYISSDIYANKGLDHFIQMAISVCRTNNNAHFMIAGKPADPAYMESCIQMIQLSGYSSHFSFFSFNRDIQSLYPAMDVVVIPSLMNEGFGLTALEGLIFGKPVVAYRSGGLSEILNATGNGAFLANKGDVQDLTVRVQQLLSDRYLRQGVGEHNSQVVRKVFGLEAYQSRLEHFLSQIGPRIEARAIALQSAPRFPDGYLLKGKSSNTVFLVEQGKKRPFYNMDAFHFYKFKWRRVTTISDDKLVNHPTGGAIRAEEPFLHHAPATYVAKGSTTTVFLLKQGVKYPFPSVRALRRYGYEMTQVVTLPETALAAYTFGDSIADEGDRSARGRLRRKRKRRLIAKRKLIMKRKLKKRVKLRKGILKSGKRVKKKTTVRKPVSMMKLSRLKRLKPRVRKAASAARKAKKKSIVKKGGGKR
ncbi:glycosyltransferase family 4 protein [Paenibacillus sp. GCM10027628]|uniref:glycosyltransferase family 4 protein n=1 Tax=Paenibacillus sp. GCM10027628 TaxID=3273413 RepID=UPI00362C35B5